MFSLSYSSFCEIQGHIKFTRFPILGLNEDIDGNRWHIYGIIGKYLQACEMGRMRNYYTSTSNGHFSIGTAGSNVVSQTWKPYTYEIVK